MSPLASSLEPRAVEWRWHPYFPVGKLTAVAGQMGQAKSLLTCWMAGQLTTGRMGDVGSVLMFSAEDDPADTIVPRLLAVGADLDRVHLDASSVLTSERVEQALEEDPDIALVTVDPLQAYLPAGVNSWKGQDVRRVLEPHRRIAAERNLTYVLVQHLNRRSDATDPLARIADSQGIPQLARSVLLWGPDPSDPAGDAGSAKVLTRVKGNLSRAPASATFTITEATVADGIVAPELVRGSDRELSADDVLADAESRSATEEASEWLRVQLADGPLAASEVKQRAERDGIANRTLRRAKTRAGVVSEQARRDDVIRGWVWKLEVPINPDGHLGHLGSSRPPRDLEGQDGQDGHTNHGATQPLAAINGVAP